MLNAKKKKRAAKVRADEDRKQKWCGVARSTAGYHGAYVGKRCPLCDIESRKR
jgi:hypothetical protein